MKIAIHAFGTRGDVQPYLALGLELRARGHDVTLSAPRDFRAWIESWGLTARCYNLHMGELLRRADELGITRNPLKAFLHSREIIDPMMDACFDEAIEGTRGADYVIAHPKAQMSAIGAEAAGAGFAMTAPLPIIAPTVDFPMPGTFRQDRGAFLNWLSWQPLKLAPLAFGKRVARAREAAGLPRGRWKLDYGRFRGEPCLRLTANSSHIVPRPSDWGPLDHMTGWWVLPPTPEPLDAQIETFLAAGPPPVYVGFGSMVSGQADRLVAAAMDGLRQAGMRGIINRGWAQLPATTSDDILVIDGAPHDRLFPRCAAIVHHGGAGTTGTALMAGKVSLIVPFMVDQPWWAARLHATGLGPRALPPGRFTAARFADALRAIAANPDWTAGCELMADKLAAEAGCVRAADLIEADAPRWRTGPGLS